MGCVLDHMEVGHHMPRAAHTNVCVDGRCWTSRSPPPGITTRLQSPGLNHHAPATRLEPPGPSHWPGPAPPRLLPIPTLTPPPTCSPPPRGPATRVRTPFQVAKSCGLHTRMHVCVRACVRASGTWHAGGRAGTRAGMPRARMFWSTCPKQSHCQCLPVAPSHSSRRAHRAQLASTRCGPRSARTGGITLRCQA